MPESGQQKKVTEHIVRGWGEHRSARYSLKDAALEHAEAELKAMQERSKRADKAGAGLRMAVCVMCMCVSQDMLCAVSFMMQYKWHIRHKGGIKDTETHTGLTARL